jgi:hypothetical protein
VEDLRIVLVPSFRIPGRLLLEQPTALPDLTVLSALRISLVRDPDLPGIPGVSVTAGVNTQATFTLANVTQGDFRVFAAPLLSAPSAAGTQRRTAPKPLENTFIKAIFLGASDVLKDGLHLSAAPEEPLTVVLALGGGLAGTVADANQHPAQNATVVLVPDGATVRPDLYRVTTSDRSGRFQLKGVAPGGYRVFAWEDIPDGGWFDEDLVRNAAGAARPVLIGEGMESTTDLVVSR